MGTYCRNWQRKLVRCRVPNSTAKLFRYWHHNSSSECYFAAANTFAAANATSLQTTQFWQQMLIDFETTYKTMFRTPYPVRIKVLIFNSILFFLMTADPPLFFSCSNFLVNPLPKIFYSTYNP
jgi:hypothetical protein